MRDLSPSTICVALQIKRPSIQKIIFVLKVPAQKRGDGGELSEELKEAYRLISLWAYVDLGILSLSTIMRCNKIKRPSVQEIIHYLNIFE
jgi:hypothetical protein